MPTDCTRPLVGTLTHPATSTASTTATAAARVIRSGPRARTLATSAHASAARRMVLRKPSLMAVRGGRSFLAVRILRGERAGKESPGEHCRVDAVEAGDGICLIGDERQRRADEFLPRRTRQGEPEYRSLALLSPCLQPSAVQSCVLQGDREAESRAAAGTRPRGVRAPEPVEHELFLTGAEPYPVIPD